MTDLVIVGAGGHGREALSVARAAARSGTEAWNVVGFVDDGPVDESLLAALGVPLIGGVDQLTAQRAAYVIAIGDGPTRQAIDLRIGDSATGAVVLDPTAWVGEDVELSPGVMLYPGSRCTTNVRVGRHSHVNCGATISHDCRIGAYVSISPGVLLNGGVTVEDRVFLGSGAIVLPGLTVGEGAVIGAGAVVTTDVAPAQTLVGVPAR